MLTVEYFTATGGMSEFKLPDRVALNGQGNRAVALDPEGGPAQIQDVDYTIDSRPDGDYIVWSGLPGSTIYQVIVTKNITNNFRAVYEKI